MPRTLKAFLCVVVLLGPVLTLAGGPQASLPGDALPDTASLTAADLDRSFLQWQVTPEVLTGNSPWSEGVESAWAESRLDGFDLVLTIRPRSSKQISADTSLTWVSVRLNGGSFADGSRFRNFDSRFATSDTIRRTEIRLPIISDSRLSKLCPEASSEDLRAAISRHPRPRPLSYVQSSGGMRGSLYLSGFDTPTWSVTVLADAEMLPLRNAHWSATGLNSTIAGFTLAEIFLPGGTKSKVVLASSADAEPGPGDTVKIGTPFSILPLSLTQYLAAKPHFSVAAMARAHPFMFLTYKPQSKATRAWWDPVLDLSLGATLWIGQPTVEKDSVGGLISEELSGALGVRLSAGIFITGAPERWAVEVRSGDRWRVPEPRGFYTRVDLLFGGMDLVQGISASSLAKWSRKIAQSLSSRQLEKQQR